MSINRIRSRIDRELPRFISRVEKDYHLRRLSPELAATITDFICREGKRIRPVLFVLGYLGFSSKQASGLYTSALATELLHDFLLVHDDIIDRSDLRRNKPTAHKMFESYLKKFKEVKCTGSDLAIIMGDILYAMAVQAFLAIKEDHTRKEKALRTFLNAAVYTGCGEFIELIYSLTPLSGLNPETITTIYDYKTSYYTFSCPLSSGAALGGSSARENAILTRFGLLVGRAFQMKDDLIGMMHEEKTTGKSSLSDLQEAKKTMLIWHAYTTARNPDKKRMERLLKKKAVTRDDLLLMRTLIRDAGAIPLIEQDIRRCLAEGEQTLAASAMKERIKQTLAGYIRRLFDSLS